MKYFVYAIIIVVSIAVVFGFFIVGSPKTARLEKLDDLRVQNLSSLQYNIISYVALHDKLPEYLEDVQYIPEENLIDPETRNPYVYEKTGNLTFKLCAEFSFNNKEKSQFINKRLAAPIIETIPQKPGASVYLENYSWDHDSGETCFDRVLIIKNTK